MKKGTRNTSKIKELKTILGSALTIEKINITDPEIMAFLKKSRKFDHMLMIKMDLEFVRVIEDLIEILVKKNVLLITDFNQTVINKLSQRKSLRESLDGLYHSIDLKNN